MTPSAVDGSLFVELELQVRDDRCFFIAASDRLTCTVVVRHMVQRSDGATLEIFSFEGVSAEVVDELASSFPGVGHHRVIRATDDEVLLEAVVTGPCIGRTLADRNAIVEHASATGGTASLRIRVHGETPPGDVVEAVSREHPGTSLVAKRNRVPVSSAIGGDFEYLLSELTDQQYRALQTAVACGYFEWPRRSTASECADALGVSQPTFSQHLRRAQEKILTTVVE